MSKAIAIIGSTGSIGQSTIRVAKRLNLTVHSLVCNSDIYKLKEQADELNPKYLGVIDESKYKEAKALFGSKLVCGKDALTFACSAPEVDAVVVSVVGINGIYPLIEAIKNGKRVALSNKESLVAAGEIAMRAKAKYKGQLIPVDSEHSAVFQCLKAGRRQDLKRIILTASGGAFYQKSQDELEKITPKDIYHPNWNMGKKITLDSSTLMNKALEIIEAYWLFGLKSPQEIDYVVHPQSLIHSLVEFKDGALMAQLSMPDMELPIQYALSYPKRTAVLEQMTAENVLNPNRPLTFLPKNPLFKAPELAFEALRKGGASGAVLNAANEAAAELFWEEKIGFLNITRLVKNALDCVPQTKADSVDEIIDLHNSVKARVRMDYIKLLEK